MILPLVYYPDARLRAKGAPIKVIDDTLRQLADDMLDTMEKHEGVGLAAQQIGQALQFAVVDVTGIDDRPSTMTIAGKAVNPEDYMPLFLINPVVTGTKAKEPGSEGCLSIPGLRTDVNRSKRVEVKTMTMEGKVLEFEATGLLAVAIQHETDHLHGKLFIDLLSPAERADVKDELDEIVEKYGPKE
ncbi:peptide deformylase [Verrucomicrobium sp. GAS474]|uniref:peptide deformylase n=1 Tax=Verrucomicrobium sp. GAS474 TaxID=1882831 RepID=UPI00087AA434|nr:peptide deformylase [Verrucomicrobium sp. GAS474]SDU01902.1 peptide deformylase [Verrucomicrobium sp. GAS474]